nr:nucleoid-associated protein [uncultured Flavobacterium sp.]
MELKKLVLHQILKEQQGKPTLNCSEKLLNIDNQGTIEFVQRLIKSYSTKNPTQGTFEKDEDIYPFQKKAKEYLNGNDFLKFTSESMEILKKEIDIPTTTGGYVVFVHYEERQMDFIITAMMDKSSQFAVDDEALDIKKLMTLDIEKLARANRLNINRWKNNDVLYLSFIKGTRAVSKYFIEFIGSTDMTSSRENFNKLKDAMSLYYIESNISKVKRDKIRDNISDYVQKCFDAKVDVELESISSIMDKEKPDLFLRFLEQNGIEVSGRIGINRRTDFEVFVRNKIIESGYTLTFDNALIKNRKIIRKGNQIIINDVPVESLNKIFNDEIKK